MNRLRTFLCRFDRDYLLLFVLILGSLFPLLRSGYLSDDATNSFTGGYLALEHRTLWQHTFYYMNQWIQSIGRFFPLAWYGYAVFVWIGSLFVYKLTILFVVLLDIFLFTWLLKRLFANDRIVKLFLLLVTVCIQFRNYHDPILSFAFLLPLVFFYTLVSLLLFDSYLSRPRILTLFGSTFFYAVSLLTYEITYVFFIFHLLLLAYRSRERVTRTLLKAWPFIVSAGLAVLLSLWLRQGKEHGSYEMVLSVPRYLSTFAKQFLSAFPLSYSLRLLVQAKHRAAFLTNITLSDLLLTFLFFSLYLKFSAAVALKTVRQYFFLLILAGALLVLPASIVAISPKVQAELRWGLGYLPVFIQLFGAALLLVTVVSFLSRGRETGRWNRLPSLGLGLLLSFAVLVTLQNNRQVVEETNAAFRYPRELIGQALQRGLTADIPEQSRLLLNNGSDTPWDNKYYFFTQYERAYEVVSLRDRATVPVPAEASSDHILTYRSVPPSDGYAFTSPVGADCYRALDCYSTGPVRLYVQAETDAPFFLTVRARPSASAVSTDILITSDHLRLLQTGNGWRLYELAGVEQLDALSISLTFGSPPAYAGSAGL